MIKLNKDLILGSASPRRQVVFNMLSIPFSCMSPNIDESIVDKSPSDSLKDLAKYIAEKKSITISEKKRDSLVISYDTAVLINGKMLGKPKSKKDAFDMLNMLKNREHEVVSGVAVSYDKTLLNSDYQVTRVYFQDATQTELNRYIETGEPMDKAGAYGIQGKGAYFVKKIEGCFYNVMGVPLESTLNLLKKYREQ